MDTIRRTRRTIRAIGTAGLIAALLAIGASPSSLAIDGTDCKDLPGHEALAEALTGARNDDNGGFDLDMWGAIVNRDGVFRFDVEVSYLTYEYLPRTPANVALTDIRAQHPGARGPETKGAVR